MTKITILAPLPFIHSLSYTNIMCLKRSHFSKKIHDYENENRVQSEKLEKSQIYCFHPCHVLM